MIEKLSAKKIKEYYYKELLDAKIYEILAEQAKEKALSKNYKRFAQMEKEHAEFWKEVAEKRNINVKNIKISSLKIKVYKVLGKILGTKLINKYLESKENKTIKEYYAIYNNDPSLSKKEKERLREIIADELVHEHTFEGKKENDSDDVEHIRDIFLGMNDGLVEILAVLAGLVGLYPDKPLVIGLTGLIVGISGTLSMAIGTYISVKNQKEVKEKLKLDEKITKEIGEEPLEEADEVVENPIKAAYTTGIFYIIGTLLVTYPFFLGIYPPIALAISAITATLTWIIAAYIIALFSGLNVKKKIIEMLITGLGAATLTYSIGRTIDYLVGGTIL